MALLLRTLKANKWYRQEAQPFLEQGDVPADPVSDIPTKQNLLSVYEVQNDETTILNTVCAIFSGRDRLDNVGYAVFDSQHLEKVGIEIREVPGTTLDPEANRRHRDLVLSGTKLIGLTRIILLHGRVDEILKKQMGELLLNSVREKRLPETVVTRFKLNN